ncbi:MAG: hypothetical protein FD165_2864, partial [Gammaproteobacteria bacterium]
MADADHPPTPETVWHVRVARPTTGDKDERSVYVRTRTTPATTTASPPPAVEGLSPLNTSSVPRAETTASPDPFRQLRVTSTGANSSVTPPTSSAPRTQLQRRRFNARRRRARQPPNDENATATPIRTPESARPEAPLSARSDNHISGANQWREPSRHQRPTAANNHGLQMARMLSAMAIASDDELEELQRQAPAGLLPRAVTNRPNRPAINATPSVARRLIYPDDATTNNGPLTSEQSEEPHAHRLQRISAEEQAASDAYWARTLVSGVPPRLRVRPIFQREVAPFGGVQSDSQLNGGIAPRRRTRFYKRRPDGPNAPATVIASIILEATNVALARD